MKNRRNGFTLLEIQVVIVIMVALAIVIVPKLLSPIEKARQEEHIAKARLAYFACQIIATEKNAKKANELLELNRILEDEIDDKNNSQLDRLLGTDMEGSYVKGETSPKGIVAKVTYIDKGKNYKITLEQMDTGNGKIYVEDFKTKIKK